MSKQSYIIQLRAIIQQHDDAIDALGKRFREEVVVPLCRKYRLSFVVSQGGFWFMKSIYTKDERARHNAPHYSERKYLYNLSNLSGAHGYKVVYKDISKAAKKALEPVLDMLNEDIAHNNLFGDHVAGVCPVCFDYQGDCVCSAG